jgi:hypothetical protein
MHPDEQTLLDFVEGERDPEVERHVATCAACTEQLRLLEAGRDALRGAPLLELSEARRRAIVAALPERRERRRFDERFAPAAAAAAALLLVAGVVALATLAGGGGGNDEGAGVGAGEGGGGGVGAAETAQSQADQGTTQPSRASKATLLDRYGEPARTVRGPVEEVLRLLHGNGIAAVRRDGSVVAVGSRASVRSALAGRPDGQVAVYVK